MKIVLSILIKFVIISSIPCLASGIDDLRPLKLGEKVENVYLHDIDGKKIPVEKIYSGKPVVFLIFRGGWCPYCNLHLSDIRNYEKNIASMGFRIVAISTDSPESMRKTSEKLSLNYELYSDSDVKFIKALGIAYSAPKHYENILNKSSNGNNRDVIPAPSVFVVNKSGTVKYSYISKNYKERISGKLLLNSLKKL